MYALTLVVSCSGATVLNNQWGYLICFKCKILYKNNLSSYRYCCFFHFSPPVQRWPQSSTFDVQLAVLSSPDQSFQDTILILPPRHQSPARCTGLQAPSLSFGGGGVRDGGSRGCKNLRSWEDLWWSSRDGVTKGANEEDQRGGYRQQQGR